jgi:hypothetical protein
LLPASLQTNFRQEIRKCGDPIYMLDNFWEVRVVRSAADKGPARALRIPDEFLRKEGRYFVTIPGREPNFNTLPLDVRLGINRQISALIDDRYTFINYNGLTNESVKVLLPEDDPRIASKFDNSVVIVDEERVDEKKVRAAFTATKTLSMRALNSYEAHRQSATDGSLMRSTRVRSHCAFKAFASARISCFPGTFIAAFGVA